MLYASAIISRYLIFQGGTKTKILVEVRRRIIEIQRKRPRIRTIVPSATPIERHDRRRAGVEVRIQDADFSMYRYHYLVYAISAVSVLFGSNVPPMQFTNDLICFSGAGVLQVCHP